MSKQPEVLWAQRSSATVQENNVVFLTVNLPDIVRSTVEFVLSPTSVSFKATTASGEHYAFSLNFYAEVDPEHSALGFTPSRYLHAVLCKKEAQSEYWPRLTNEEVMTPYIKTDIHRWIDEDEQEGIPDAGDEDGIGVSPAGRSFAADMFEIGFSKISADSGAGFSGVEAEEGGESDSDDDA